MLDGQAFNSHKSELLILRPTMLVSTCSVQHMDRFQLPLPAALSPQVLTRLTFSFIEFLLSSFHVPLAKPTLR